MVKTIEKRTVIQKEDEITRVNILDGGKSIDIFSISSCCEHPKEVSKSNTQEYIEKYFPIVKASTLSLEDEFLKHEPNTENQKKFKRKLIAVIKSGLSDFRAQRMDSSIDDEGNIYYKEGMFPAVGKSANWWYKKAKEFMPERESRLGTTGERIAFLGLVIKCLIEYKKYTVSDAWIAVCDQSKDLGNCWDSENTDYESFEPTGSRQIGEWYDLLNTIKITFDSGIDGFWIVGGSCIYDGDASPLSCITYIRNSYADYYDSTGWIVLSV